MNKAELIEAIAKDCALAGVRITKQTQGATFGERVKAIANGGGGIVIEGPGEVRISDSDVAGNTGHGISWISSEASNSFRLVLGGVACDDNTIDGIHLDFSGAAASACTFVDGRYVLRAGVEATSGANNNGGHGLYVSGGNKGSIDLDGSDFSGNTQAGLILIADDGVKPGSVNRVDASGNGSHGIQLQGSGVYRFSNCRAAKNGGDGIRAERPTAGADRWGELIFETNDLVGNSGAGLNIPTNATATVAGAVIVTGGLISGNATAGILIADNGVKPGSVNRVSVTGNGGHGLVVAGDDFRIEDNLVSRNTGSGIRVSGSGAHLARNQCSANVTGIEVTGLGNAVRENIFGGTAAQTPLNVTTPGNAVAPTQAVDTGTNPLGNVGY